MDIHTLINTAPDIEGALDVPGVEIECPECKAFSPASEWSTWEVPCESCGGHFTLSCPEHHFFDPYGGDHTEFNTRKIP